MCINTGDGEGVATAGGFNFKVSHSCFRCWQAPALVTGGKAKFAVLYPQLVSDKGRTGSVFPAHSASGKCQAGQREEMNAKATWPRV